MMLQNDKPEDFVIASGRMETVRKFCEISAIALGWVSKDAENQNGIIWEGKERMKSEDGKIQEKLLFALILDTIDLLKLKNCWGMPLKQKKCWVGNLKSL